MSHEIFSFSNADLNPDIREYQKRVFEKFQIPLTQVVWEKDDKYLKPNGWYNDHIHFLEKTLKTVNVDYFIFFDVDCIPLSASFLNILLNDIAENDTVSGAFQASHFGEYVGAYFIGVSKKLYFECGCPPITIDQTDPFQLFTTRCLELGKRVKYWMPTHSDGTWYVPSRDVYYGFGTTFDHMIYHQFQIRDARQHAAFINKCQEVLRS